MRQAFPKREITRLARKGYDALRKGILQRDGWRCQFCGARRNLEVHHIEYRSYLGADTEVNLITLCACCHRSMHGASGTTSSPG